MGFKDPYHEHSLIENDVDFPKDGATCYRCELPVTLRGYFSCDRCNHFLHQECNELPDKLHHPLHVDHPLTLFAPQPPPPFSDHSLSNDTITTTKLCNQCHDPCNGFTYFCSICDFNLHLRCFLTIKHEKHEHPLSFSTWGKQDPCDVCGYEIEGQCFGCKRCKICIHRECTFLPPTVKHHHVHELTFHHEFPSECDQVYCDRCEDTDGELDRTLSYYYCKPCDYIAHVRCVTQPQDHEETDVIEHFSHEHPLRPYRVDNWGIEDCQVCGIHSDGPCYYCKKCDYFVHKSCVEFPFFFKHPLHQEHALTLNKAESDGIIMLKCTDCEKFTLDPKVAFMFKHPHHEYDLCFSNCNRIFICDACGELGEGFRIKSCTTAYGRQFDLHLECFALPGQIQHLCHPYHPLFLLPNISISMCNICHKDIETELWMYCCEECIFLAHLNCVASNLLSTLRTTIGNQSDFCTIIQFEVTSYKKRGEAPRNICLLLLRGEREFYYRNYGVLFSARGLNPRTLDGVHLRACGNSEVKLSEIDEKNMIDCLHCTHPLSRQVESDISDSFPCFDEIICPICTVLIFPPFYSCSHCNSFFHESCVELPREHTSECGHTFQLMAKGSFLSKNCACCKNIITGFAYVCHVCGIFLDVTCASQVPVYWLKSFRDLAITSSPRKSRKCVACENEIPLGTYFFTGHRHDFSLNIHIECALLPRTIKHRIHQHPLGLAMDLAELGDDYICDACEMDLNQNLWAYRCVDDCGGYATSHVTCVIDTKRKCHFRYEDECRRPPNKDKEY